MHCKVSHTEQRTRMGRSREVSSSAGDDVTLPPLLTTDRLSSSNLLTKLEVFSSLGYNTVTAQRTHVDKIFQQI